MSELRLLLSCGPCTRCTARVCWQWGMGDGGRGLGDPSPKIESRELLSLNSCACAANVEYFEKYTDFNSNIHRLYLQFLSLKTTLISMLMF